MTQIRIVLVFALFFPFVGETPARDWVDTTGKYRISADFVKLEGGVVYLKLKDNKHIKVPLDRFREDDRIFARLQSPINFTTDIRPILETRCVSCHGEEDQQGELRLDSHSMALKGGERGPAFVAGKPDQSLLFKLVSLPKGDAEIMPATGEPLTKEQLAIIHRWIAEGAKWTGTLQAREAKLVSRGNVGATFITTSGTTTYVYTEDMMAFQVDKQVAEHLMGLKIKPAPIVNDEMFVRRAYLDIVGRIPTYDEAVVFLRSTNPKKREMLIDKLIDSPGYESHMYNFWAVDMLRIKPMREDATSRYPYWVKEAVAKNKPYDQMVYELLTPIGNPGQNGAVGYFIGDPPLVNVSMTSQVFLGTQIGCAQCHDHKFDKWTQKQFYELAAFQGTIKGVTNYVPINEVRQAAMKRGVKFPKAGNNYDVLKSLYRLNDNDYPLKFPEDYAYNNARPNSVVTPAFLFDRPELTLDESWVKPTSQKKKGKGKKGGARNLAAKKVALPRNIQAPDGPTTNDPKRLTYAKWVISKSNPRFGPVMANRLWKRVMGTGLVEPIDDWKDDTRPVDPKLLEYLTTEFKRDFKIKEYLRSLYKTKTYQRHCLGDGDLTSESYHMQARQLRRMTAEQVYDSWITLSIADPDTRKRKPSELETHWAEFLAGPPTAARAATALLKATNGGKNGKALSGRLWDKAPNIGLVRASELLYPKGVGTVLGTFGQSPRLALHESSEDPGIEQVLLMLNGNMVDRVLQSNSVLQQQLGKAPNPDQKVEVLFLSILTRFPNQEEQLACSEVIRKKGATGVANVTRALLNSREFLFVQ